MKKYFIGISIVLIASMGFLFAYDQELIWAYNYAYNIGITTMPTIDQANMNGKLLRSHMAKMMSKYAMEVLNLVPNTGKLCTFDDISWQTEEMKGFILQSCQLWLMGVEVTSFNPTWEVTRAQFGTVLSRAMYGEVNNGWEPYYVKHLTALQASWVMKDISKPNNLEIRWYVMLMMQRADDVITNTGVIIDVIAPTAKIAYSTTGSTTGTVTATLTWRSEAITWVNTYTHIFTGNGSFIFYFQDLSGNAGSTTATVSNIVDGTKPTASVKYSTTWATNSDVIVTLTWRSETITGVNAYTRTFTGNGTYTFTFSDLAGNTGSVIATVDNIDKIAPIATVTLSPGNPGSWNYITWDIIATLTWRVGTITGVNAYTHTFTGNGNFIFTFSDLAGNLWFATGTVDYWTWA